MQIDYAFMEEMARRNGTHLTVPQTPMVGGQHMQSPPKLVQQRKSVHKAGWLLPRRLFDEADFSAASLSSILTENMRAGMTTTQVM